MKSTIRILFFIGSLGTGGKERRLIELLTYLKQRSGYEILLVLAFDKINYPGFFELGIRYKIINKRLNFKDPTLFFRLNKILKDFKPDIIHTWSNMVTFYTLPLATFRKIPIVNSQITSAKPKQGRISIPGLAARLNLKYSSVITSNSYAGLSNFNLTENGKYRVIYNGINMERFNNLPSFDTTKNQFGLNTKHAIVMAASFSDAKDYERYLKICGHIERKRNDITFYAAGDGDNLFMIRDKAKIENLENIRFTGRIDNVEALISICDLGVLLTNSRIHGEGISNSILEYMALGKPVIANNAGGTKEILKNDEYGYLVTNESDEKIADIIIDLIDNREKREKIGRKCKEIIRNSFTLENMGTSFENLYRKLTQVK